MVLCERSRLVTMNIHVQYTSSISSGFESNDKLSQRLKFIKSMSNFKVKR